MNKWTKALVCMVLFFSFLFSAVGYAALSDTLTISGSAEVSVCYSITYMIVGVDPIIRVITDNTVAVSTAWPEAEQAAVEAMGDGYVFEYWVNAGSTPVDELPIGNTESVILYPSFKDRYTVTYVNNEGNAIYSEVITAGQQQTNVIPDVPEIEGGYTGEWSITDFSNVTSDVTVYPIYNADDGIVKLTPVDEEPQDGVIDYYKVTSVVENDANINIVIPGIFNGKPITEISGGAFAEFDNITTVKIPTSITYIGADAFANKENSGFLGALKYEQITFLYEGTYEQWQAIEKDENWDRYVGQGSRIYFIADGTYIEETGRNGTWSETDRVWSEPVEGTYSG